MSKKIIVIVCVLIALIAIGTVSFSIMYLQNNGRNMDNMTLIENSNELDSSIDADISKNDSASLDNGNSATVGETDTVLKDERSDANNRTGNGEESTSHDINEINNVSSSSIFPINENNYAEVLPQAFNTSVGNDGRRTSIDYILSLSVPLDEIPSVYQNFDNLVYFYYMDPADASISFAQEEIIDSKVPTLISNNGTYTIYRIDYTVLVHGNDIDSSDATVDRTVYIRYDNATKKIVEMH